LKIIEAQQKQIDSRHCRAGQQTKENCNSFRPPSVRFLCGKTGHIKMYCRSEPREASESESNVKFSCLIDTGSMVSTLTDSFYRKFIKPLGTALVKNSFIQLKPSNAYEIPYIGYIEIDVQYQVNFLEKCDFPIVKD
jgi:hypothetical protein